MAEPASAEQAGPVRADPAGASRHDDLLDEVGAKLNEIGDATKALVADIDQKAGRNLPAATVVGLAILGAIGASLIWWPWGMVVIVAVGVVGGEIEFARALRERQGVRLVFWPLVIGSVVLSAGAYAWHVWDIGLNPAWWVIGTAGMTMVVTLGLRLTGPIDGYVRDVAATGLVLLYLPVFSAGLLFILAQPQGPLRVATVILAVAGVDTGGYVAGLALGRHPMSPRISPKKSWEGAAGSLVLSGVVTTLMVALALKQPWWQGIVLAVVIVVAAMVGDLVESIIKRDLGIKDMGSILAGHGGILDRIDSYLVVAIPAWLVLSWLLSHA